MPESRAHHGEVHGSPKLSVELWVILQTIGVDVCTFLECEHLLSVMGHDIVSLGQMRSMHLNM